MYKFSVKNTMGYYRDYSGLIKIEPAEKEMIPMFFDMEKAGVDVLRQGKIEA